MEENHYGFIYKTTNLIDGMYYIGLRTITHNYYDKTYLGSGVYFKKALKKYGRKNFKRIIICYCENQEELEKWEKHFIAVWDAKNPLKGYNLDNGGNCAGKHSKETKEKLRQRHLGMKVSLESRMKISESRKGKCFMSKETLKRNSERWKGENNPSKRLDARKRISVANKGRRLTEEQKQKIRENAKNNPNFGMKGKHLSEEQRKKVSEAAKRRFSNPIEREKMRQRKLGIKMSEEQKKKISESCKIFFKTHPEIVKHLGDGVRGRHRSEETRRKISESNKGKIVPVETRIKLRNSQKKTIIDQCIGNKIIKTFIGIREASRVTGINRQCISFCVRGIYKTAGGYNWKIHID